MTKRFFTLWILLMGFWTTAAMAQLEEISQLKITPEESKRLLDLLNKPVEPGALNSTKSELLRQKSMAARLLGDTVNEEKWLREWMQVTTEPFAKWGLRELLWQKGQREEAYRLGEELTREVTWPPSRANAHVELAFYYMQDQDLKKAGALINKAGEIIRYEFGGLPRRGAAPYGIARAEMTYFMGKSELESRSGQWARAAETSQLAVAKSKDVLRMISMVTNEDDKARGREFLLAVQATHAKRQREAGLYSEAESTLRDLFRSAKEFGLAESMMLRFYNQLVEHYNAAGQFKDALTFSKKMEIQLEAQGYDKNSRYSLGVQARTNTALLGLDAWSELLKRIEAPDANSQTTDIRDQGRLKGLVYLKNQRHEKALEILTTELARDTESFGANHFYTAMTRGLWAQARAKNGDKELARAAFHQATHDLTAPESLSGDFAEDAIQRKIKRYVLQAYMQLLATSASHNATDAQTLFSIGDQLGASSVQQALTEAAVRAGVKIPGLSEIIRKEQDARNETASLSAYIANQNAEVPERRNPQVIAQMRQRQQELASLRKEYKAQIQKLYPEYFQLIQPKSPSHADIAAQLKPDELFISILPMEDQTYVWAIDSRGQVHFHAARQTQAEVHGLVTKIRQTLDVAGLGSRAPAFAQSDAHILYKALLGPLERALENKAHLIISTGGSLAQLPFATLVRQTGSADTAWLIKDFAISHVPSANGWLSLKKLGNQPSSKSALLAWGDPAFDIKSAQITSAPGSSVVRAAATDRGQDATARNVLDAASYVNYSKLPALPETRDEVLELAKIMAADPASDVILGKNATRQSVLEHNASGALAQKKVVVFATHGLLAGDLPNLNQPALAMAGNSNPNESPLLTLEDVLSLKLNADWVVLSACNTAGADGKAEEALTGLARGFFFAGSRSLLVTHWSVESQSAMNLTTQTFAAYQRDPQIRRAEALRQSMLATMRTPAYAHPAYWAPYALVGEGGR